ncbi:MAG: hypothetical protein ABUS79_12575 [Pseudomonadota bacterium]
MPFATPAKPFLRTAAVALLGALAAAPTACSTDIFDVGVQLGAETFPIDFGMQTGNIPAAACSAQNVTMCGSNHVLQLAGDTGQAEIIAGCDVAAGGRCYVQANALVTYTVDVLQDESFTSKVGRKTVSAVRMIDITYTVPVNTTTFDIPRVGVYVGPAGSKAETDLGVHLIDSIDGLPARTVVLPSDPRHLTVADGSPARDLMEQSIRDRTPFVVLIALSPRMESGTPVPAGKLQFDIVPLLGLGVR